MGHEIARSPGSLIHPSKQEGLSQRRIARGIGLLGIKMGINWEPNDGT